MKRYMVEWKKYIESIEGRRDTCALTCDLLSTIRTGKKKPAMCQPFFCRQCHQEAVKKAREEVNDEELSSLNLELIDLLEIQGTNYEKHFEDLLDEINRTTSNDSAMDHFRIYVDKHASKALSTWFLEPAKQPAKQKAKS